MGELKVLSVTELNLYIKSLLSGDKLLSSVYIKGEISNFTNHYKTGHLYFDLKDEGGVVSAVMFNFAANKLKFEPKGGMRVIIRGRISLYEKTGRYQVYCEGMEPDGIGALALAYEQLKHKLEAEGLFKAEYKKLIPKVPLCIGVVTSPTGAAVRDIINILKRRFPISKVLLYPVLVQGENAAGSVSAAIEYFNLNKCADVLIVGRGGGSIEDLWAFNEEIVARAIFASKIPVISAVGHETDFTIADFVADLRAPTPSAAAELCVPNISELKASFLNLISRFTYIENSMIKSKREKLLTICYNKVMRSPSVYIDERRLNLDYYIKSIINTQKNSLEKKIIEFKKNAANLDALSPLKVLGRGYTMLKKEGKVINSVNDTKIGDSLTLTLKDGELDCKVANIKNNN